MKIGGVTEGDKKIVIQKKASKEVIRRKRSEERDSKQGILRRGS